METEGLDFTGALETLAHRFGVRARDRGRGPRAASRRQRRDRLQTLLDRAAAYYARYLWEAREAADARDYLLGRGFSEETLREFRVGYAPSAWDRMLLASRRAGFSDEELLAVGLAQRSKQRPGQIYDRFRERIMFPSTDQRGRVVGFGARAMRDNQRPKYLNTSDGELYHKREQLFGIDLARGAAARAGRMILVEGYTDVLALHQAGLSNAVGIMGTSLTEEQVGELERVVSVLELCLDADRAGQDAMLRAARLARGAQARAPRRAAARGHRPRRPDRARRRRRAARALVERSVPFVVFHVERILDRDRHPQRRGQGPGDRRARAGAGRATGERCCARTSCGGSRAGSSCRRAAGVADRRGRGERGSVGPGARCRAARRDRRGVPRRARVPGAVRVLAARTGRGRLSRSTPSSCSRASRCAALPATSTGRLASPLADLPRDDEELATTVADLVARAGRAGEVSVEQLEHARLLLELGRVERAIRRARGAGSSGISDLAREREHVREQIRAVTGRMERAV